MQYRANRRIKAPTRFVLFIVLPIALTCTAGTAFADPERLERIVAFDGMQAPGFPAGTGLEFPGSPVTINNDGEVAFHAEFIGETSDAIWTEGSGTLQAIAVSGDAPAGVADPGAEYSNLGRRVLIDNTGHTAFNALWVDGDGEAQQGFWASQPDGTVRKVATTGMVAPGTPPDHIFTKFGSPTNFVSYDDAEFFLGGGRVAFFGDTVDDPAADDPLSGTLTGIWSERPTAFERQLAVVARNGDDTTFGNRPLLTGMNRLGQTIFHVVINQPDESFRSIWSENGNVLLMVVRDGTDTGGVDFVSLGNNPDINANGPSVFSAEMDGPPGDEDTAIFKQSPQQAGPVVVEGTVAPGLPDLSGDGVPDFLFGDFNFPGNKSHLMNRDGLVAFRNRAATPDNSQTIDGIWTGVGVSRLKLVAAEGGPAPGLAAGTVFTNSIPLGNEWVLNERGHLMFRAEFETPDGTTGRGLWLWDGDKLIDMLVAVPDTADPDAEVQPDTLELPDGSTLEIDFFEFTGGGPTDSGANTGDGRGAGFSDTGELAVMVFDDLRGAVITLNEFVFASDFE